MVGLVVELRQAKTDSHPQQVPPMADVWVQLEALSARLANLERGNQAPMTNKTLAKMDPCEGDRDPIPLHPIPLQSAQIVSADLLERNSTIIAAGGGVVDTDHTDTGTVEQSIWTAILLFGLPQIGWGGSAMLVFGMLVNVTLQFLFCWIIRVSFLQKDDKYNEDEIKTWRVREGHHYATRDPDTGASHISKVCNGNFLDRLWWQHNLLDEIDYYLMGFDGSRTNLWEGRPTIPVGTVLCTLAAMVWLSYCIVEVGKAIHFFLCVYKLGKMGSTDRIVGSRLQGYSFVSMSAARVLSMFWVTVFRISVACVLAVTGTLWLANTKSIQDIVLNAAGLCFILDIDELMYEIFPQKPTRKFLESLRPLPHITRLYWFGMDLSSITLILGISVAMPVVTYLLISENKIEAENIRNTLCGEPLDFVYAAHKEMGLLWTSDTQKYGANAVFGSPGLRPFVEDTILAYTPSSPPNTHTGDFWIGETQNHGMVTVKNMADPTQMIAQSQMPALKFVSQTDWRHSMFNCEDTLSEALAKEGLQEEWNRGPGWLWSALRTQTSSEVASCADVGSYCDNPALPLVRAMCPKSCGCLSPVSGLAVSGCRPLCEQDHRFQEALGNASCEDDSLGREVWGRWWRGWADQTAKPFGSWPETANEIQMGRASGTSINCSYLTADMWQIKLICTGGQEESGYWRPGTALCPRTCGCGMFDRSQYISRQDIMYCPPACNSSPSV